MSSELEAAFNSMAINQIPELWKKDSYPSMKPLGSYLADLYARLNMLQTWYETGQPPIFWMSGFYFVQSFLTAALQNYARKHELPIDEVGYDHQMLGMDPKEYVKPPEAGVYVYGMFIEGCNWDPEMQALCESDPKVLFVSAPCMWLVPRRQSDSKDAPHYPCPLYRTADRRGVLATTGHSTNFVMFVKMPSQHEPQHWTKRGVAMVLSLSD
jgi:dynein heavy chain